MSRYFDDELAHSGVKGMKWRKHKYRLVKDANGKLRYVYDNDNTGTGVKSSKAQMFRQARAEEKDKDIGKRSNTGTKPLTETYLVSTKTTNNGPLQTSKLRSTVLTGRSGERKQREEKQEATRDRKAIERMARNERRRQAEANNHKAKATGKRASWASDKPYQSKVEYDQENQRHWLKERDKLRKQGEPSLLSPPHGNGSASKYHDEFYKDQQRNAKRSMEGFETGLSERHNSPSLAGPGHRARAAESTARHKAAVKAQKQHTARTEEATARRKAATNKYVGEHAAQQYRIKKTQEAVAEKRKKADDWRKADPSIESLGYSSNPYDTRATGHYNKGDSDRFRNVPDFRYEPSKETKKRLRRNKRKKAVSDTKRAIDKGRKAVEEFFTPKKKKKR
jgi:hypothetical protein